MSQKLLYNSPQTNHQPGSTYLDFIQNRRGKRKERDHDIFSALDDKMIRIQDIIWQMADTNVPVLLTGESGVGKSFIGKKIHDLSSSEKDKFIKIDCSKIKEEELFGFEKNNESKKGIFEEYSKGTIYFEEITDISMDVQNKILKLMKDNQFERVGGKNKIQFDSRIIASSKKDMLKLVKEEKFRQDLYYRLYVLHLDIPPLRNRIKDISVLVNFFIEEQRKKLNDQSLNIEESEIEKFKNYDWPGNVKELSDVVEKYVINKNHDSVSYMSSFQENETHLFEWVKSLPIGETLELLETQFILETLKTQNGNRTHAAKILGISLRTLRNKINEFTSKGFEVMPPSSGRSYL
jgi:two-component system response regulator AtoC